MSTTPLLTTSRLLFTLLAGFNSIMPYVFDYNVTHVFNPNWPPHARFHNGQTMSMGFLLGLTTLYYTWRPLLSSTRFTKAMVKDSLFSAAVAASLYWVTGLSAGLYPGSLFLDPEFVGSEWDVRVFGGPVQVTVFSGSVVGAWVAYGLGVWGLGGLKAD